MSADRVDVLVGVDEGYAKAIGAVACATTWYLPADKRLRIHVLDGGVSAETKRALVAGIGDKAEILFYEIAEPMTWDIPYVGNIAHLNDSILLRLQMGDVLPSDVTRVIYLDVDVLVHGDLSILSSWPLNGHVMGAVRDRFMPSGSPQLSEVLKHHNGHTLDRYFNSGVLVIDVDAWRRQDIGGAVRSVLSRLGHQLGFPDQDALNFVLLDKWVELPPAWDYLVGRRCPIPGGEAASRLVATDGIVHFVGAKKPWHKSFPQGALWHLFAKAAEESGWRLPEEGA